MIARLERRKEAIADRVERAKRRVLEGRIGGEEDRIWLDEFGKEGKGLDIACGDFLIGNVDNTEGVDGYLYRVGSEHFFMDGGELTNQEHDSLDFIVTNYFDVFPNVLKVLNEWHRVLKPGGRLGIVCRNAEAYGGGMGPLRNSKRVSLFTDVTLRYYLVRAGFTDVVIEKYDTSLRARAKKND